MEVKEAKRAIDKNYIPPESWAASSAESRQRRCSILPLASLRHERGRRGELVVGVSSNKSNFKGESIKGLRNPTPRNLEISGRGSTTKIVGRGGSFGKFMHEDPRGIWVQPGHRLAAKEGERDKLAPACREG